MARKKGSSDLMKRTDDQSVTISVPNNPSYLRVIRLVVASVAAELGYDYEEIEDLRIVADEVAYLVMHQASVRGKVHLTTSQEIGALTLHVTSAVADGGVRPEFDPVSRQVVSALTVQVKLGVTNGECEAIVRCHPPARLASD